MGHRRLRIVLALVSLLVQGFLVNVRVDAQEQRLVLAFYYAWYDENTWGYDKVPDMPLEPYRSADRATIERHVREARGAGIDAFVQAWYGPGTNPTESNFVTLLDVAREYGMQATVNFETTSPFMTGVESLTAGLRHLVDVHAQHPAFLRYGGRPVIFFWRQQHLSIEQWTSIREQIDPDHDTIWIADGDDLTWLSVFDGLHMYAITWRVNTNPMYTATKMRKRVDRYVADHGVQRYWVATTMPGYDDTHVEGRADPYTYPRSPEYYRSTWEAAMASTPEMVVITSYNEWREGTMIEPSVTYGSTYLDITREMAAQYRGVQGPTPTVAFTPTPVQTPTETPTPTPQLTPTETPTATHTPSPTATATATNTNVPTASPTTAPTETPAEKPTETPTATKTFTATTTYTSIASVTSTPVSQPTPTPTPTAGPPCASAGAIGFVLFSFARVQQKSVAGRRLDRRKE